MLELDATALVVFAIVWVVVLILSKIFFKPILRVLDERADKIAKDKAAAESVRTTAEPEALKAKSRLVREVQTEGRAEVEKAKAEIRREMDQLKKELDRRTEEIAKSIENRILGE
jgi:F-type H+-transporting ATPase subunit b